MRQSETLSSLRPNIVRVLSGDKCENRLFMAVFCISCRDYWNDATSLLHCLLWFRDGVSSNLLLVASEYRPTSIFCICLICFLLY